MDRGKLNSIICAYDTDHIISEQSLAFPTLELGGELSDSSSDYEVIYTPDSPLSTDSLSISHFALPNDISLQLEDAVERSSKVRCCECSKTFKSTGSLDQHRNSAVHAKPVYHCPTNLPGGTHASGFIQTFKTLSGLAQHLEAKACVGGASTLREVAAYIEGRLQQIGWKARILLQDSQ
jgi:hypothetical protein